MTFQLLDNGERLFVSSKDAIIIRFGRNGDKSYALLIGLAPMADAVLEYYFCVVDLTWLFWTKLCEKLSLERSFGYAEEEVQR